LVSAGAEIIESGVVVGRSISSRTVVTFCPLSRETRSEVSPVFGEVNRRAEIMGELNVITTGGDKSASKTSLLPMFDVTRTNLPELLWVELGVGEEECLGE